MSFSDSELNESSLIEALSTKWKMLELFKFMPTSHEPTQAMKTKTTMETSVVAFLLLCRYDSKAKSP